MVRPFSNRARRYESHIAAEGIYPHKDSTEQKADELLATSFVAGTAKVILRALDEAQ